MSASEEPHGVSPLALILVVAVVILILVVGFLSWQVYNLSNQTKSTQPAQVVIQGQQSSGGQVSPTSLAGSSQTTGSSSCPALFTEDLGLRSAGTGTMPASAGQCQVIVAHGDVNNSSTCHLKVFRQGETVAGLGNGTYRLVRITGSPADIEAQIGRIQTSAASSAPNQSCPRL